METNLMRYKPSVLTVVLVLGFVLRNTTSLLGMIETYPLRWSAEWDESADSEFSIRFEQYGAGLIDGNMHPTLGTPNQGRSYDLDSLAASSQSQFRDKPRWEQRRFTTPSMIKAW